MFAYSAFTTCTKTHSATVGLTSSKRTVGGTSSVDFIPTQSKHFRRKASPLVTSGSWDVLATESVETTLKWGLRGGSPDMERELGLLSGTFLGSIGPERLKVVKRQTRSRIQGLLIHSSIYQSIHPSIHPAVHSSIHPSVHPLFVLLSTYIEDCFMLANWT